MKDIFKMTYSFIGLALVDLMVVLIIDWGGSWHWIESMNGVLVFVSMYSMMLHPIVWLQWMCNCKARKVMLRMSESIRSVVWLPRFIVINLRSWEARSAKLSNGGMVERVISSVGSLMKHWRHVRNMIWLVAAAGNRQKFWWAATVPL